MNILIRADASVDIGSGHVMRCLALAHGLRKARARVSFVCRQAPGDLCDFIAAEGYPVQRLPAAEDGVPNPDGETDAAQTIGVMTDAAPLDWLIVDHYALDRRWESAMRSHTKAIMTIDDLANRVHDCDILLDQNYCKGMDTRYDNLTPESCKRLLGPRFALLRPEFSDTRPREPRDAPVVRRIFVFLSSADPFNVTSRVLDALDTVASPSVEVDIVAGAASPHVDALAVYCASRPGRRLHVQTAHMAELLAAADIAIGGGGATSWERACLGVPSLVIGLADNQIAIAEALASAGAQFYLGRVEDMDDSNLRAALAVLLENRQLRAALARTAFTLTDGGGVGRVICHLLARQVSFRPATGDDSDRLFAWRNHPETRRHFFDSAPIDLSAHRRWFADTLADDSRVLLIGTVDGEEAGVLRYDLSGDEARISIYLDPARRGKGIGTMLLVAGRDWLQSHYPGTQAIVAEALSANEASIRAFLAAGYRESHRCFRYDIVDDRLTVPS